MSVKPIIAVIGHKKSGKTSLIEDLIRSLRSEGLKVMSAKHVDLKGFTLDQEQTDTWRHSKAGANPVICISESEIAIIRKNGEGEFSIKDLTRHGGDADVILLEGFSRWILKDEDVGKIVMIRDRSELKEYLENVKGPVLAFCSYRKDIVGEELLDAEAEFSRIISAVNNFIYDRMRLNNILKHLPGLNCGKCGYRSCLELAKAVMSGKASVRECAVRRSKEKIKTSILIDDKRIPTIPYISEFIRRTILAMISTLKGTDIQGDEYVQIRISRKPIRE